MNLQNRGRNPKVREARPTANRRSPVVDTFPTCASVSQRISRPGNQDGFRPGNNSDELEALIAEQREDDLFGHRVLAENGSWSVSVDAWASGADAVQRRAKVSDDRHGSLYCYVRLRCRCAKCRARSAEYARERRARRAA